MITFNGRSSRELAGPQGDRARLEGGGELRRAIVLPRAGTRQVISSVVEVAARRVLAVEDLDAHRVGARGERVGERIDGPREQRLDHRVGAHPRGAQRVEHLEPLGDGRGAWLEVRAHVVVERRDRHTRPEPRQAREEARVLDDRARPGEQQHRRRMCCGGDDLEARPREAIARLERLVGVAHERAELHHVGPDSLELVGEHARGVDADVGERAPRRRRQMRKRRIPAMPCWP